MKINNLEEDRQAVLRWIRSTSKFAVLWLLKAAQTSCARRFDRVWLVVKTLRLVLDAFTTSSQSKLLPNVSMWHWTFEMISIKIFLESHRKMVELTRWAEMLMFFTLSGKLLLMWDFEIDFQDQMFAHLALCVQQGCRKWFWKDCFSFLFPDHFRSNGSLKSGKICQNLCAV